MRTRSAPILVCVFLFVATPLLAQPKIPEGLFKGYDGEFRHVSEQLVALAEAIPADKYAWRPGDGVRSTSEVIMHIAAANLYLLSFTGRKMEAEINPEFEKKITSKREVIDWLKRSLSAVKTSHDATTAAAMRRQVKTFAGPATVADVYQRILIHNNEHMGQLVAYARMNGVAPPWSQ
jgi:uncharacterized damage-inducible protein DinB